MLRTMLTLAAGLTIASTMLALDNQRRWPLIQGAHLTRTINLAENVDVPVIVEIKDRNGKSIYRLECHSGDYESEDPDFDFSGDYQCVFFALKNGKRTSWNLLADDTREQQSRDWMNRGRI